jgi:hypothetical protein
MRRMLSNKATVLEVRRALRLSKAGYYRQLGVIKEEDQQWLEELALGEFVAEFRRAHDSLEGLERRLLCIADTAPRDRDKIEAIRLCKDVELDRIELLAEGPTAVAVRRKARKELAGESAEVQKAP